MGGIVHRHLFPSRNWPPRGEGHLVGHPQVRVAGVVAKSGWAIAVDQQIETLVNSEGAVFPQIPSAKFLVSEYLTTEAHDDFAFCDGRASKAPCCEKADRQSACGVVWT